MENIEENIETKQLTIKDFVVNRKIGEGSFGKTYYAKGKKSNKEYVLKLSKKKNDKSFDREIKMLKKLKEKQGNNQYIIKIINDFSEEKNYYLPDENDEDYIEGNVRYIVLEYMENGNLKEYLNKDNSFNKDYARVLFYKILKGVQNIHNSGICHLDLKLDNILLDIDCNPIICDFGLSDFIEDLKSGESKRTPGTLGLKAPELIEKKVPYDGIRADIFSLGVILFTLVTHKKYIFYEIEKNLKNGKVESKDKKDIFQKELDNYWKVAAINYPEELKKLIDEMVRYEPSERPENIGQILERPWIKEYDDLSDDKKDKLDNKIRNDLSNNQKKEITPTEKLNGDNKGEEEGKNYFKEDDLFIPELNLNDDIIMKNYIFIKGKINPRFFMNKLANKLEKLFEKNNCFVSIEENSLSYKFTINFKEEDEELENSLDIELDNKGNLKIEILLLKQDEKYLISIFKKSGESEDFEEKFELILKNIETV